MRQAYSTTYKSSSSLGWTTQNLLAQKRPDKFTATSAAAHCFVSSQTAVHYEFVPQGHYNTVGKNAVKMM